MSLERAIQGISSASTLAKLSTALQSTASAVATEVDTAEDVPAELWPAVGQTLDQVAPILSDPAAQHVYVHAMRVAELAIQLSGMWTASHGGQQDSPPLPKSWLTAVGQGLSCDALPVVAAAVACMAAWAGSAHPPHSSIFKGPVFGQAIVRLCQEGSDEAASSGLQVILHAAHEAPMDLKRALAKVVAPGLPGSASPPRSAQCAQRAADVVCLLSEPVAVMWSEHVSSSGSKSSAPSPAAAASGTTASSVGQTIGAFLETGLTLLARAMELSSFTVRDVVQAVFGWLAVDNGELGAAALCMPAFAQLSAVHREAEPAARSQLRAAVCKLQSVQGDQLGDWTYAGPAHCQAVLDMLHHLASGTFKDEHTEGIAALAARLQASCKGVVNPSPGKPAPHVGVDSSASTRMSRATSFTSVGTPKAVGTDVGCGATEEACEASQAQAAKLETEYQKLQTQCTTMQRRVEELTTELNAAAVELARVRKECQATQAETEEEATLYASLQTKLAAAQMQRQSAQATYAVMQAGLQRASAQVSQASAQQTQLADQAKQAEADTAQLQAAHKQAQAARQQAQADLQAAQQQATQLRERAAVAQTEVKELQAGLAASAQEIASLQAQQSAAAGAASLRAQLASVRDELAQAQSAQVESEAVIAAQRASLAAMTPAEEVQALRAKLSQTRAELAEHASELRSVRAAARRASQEAEQQVAAAQSAAAASEREARAAIAAAQLEDANTSSTVVRQQSQIAQLQQQLQEVQARAEQAEGKAAKLEQALDKAKQAAMAAKAGYSAGPLPASTAQAKAAAELQAQTESALRQAEAAAARAQNTASTAVQQRGAAREALQQTTAALESSNAEREQLRQQLARAEAALAAAESTQGPVVSATPGTSVVPLDCAVPCAISDVLLSCIVQQAAGFAKGRSALAAALAAEQKAQRQARTACQLALQAAAAAEVAASRLGEQAGPSGELLSAAQAMQAALLQASRTAAAGPGSPSRAPGFHALALDQHALRKACAALQSSDADALVCSALQLCDDGTLAAQAHATAVVRALLRGEDATAMASPVARSIAQSPTTEGITRQLQFSALRALGSPTAAATPGLTAEQLDLQPSSISAAVPIAWRACVGALYDCLCPLNEAQRMASPRSTHWAATSSAGPRAQRRVTGQRLREALASCGFVVLLPFSSAALSPGSPTQLGITTTNTVNGPIHASVPAWELPGAAAVSAAQLETVLAATAAGFGRGYSGKLNAVDVNAVLLQLAHARFQGVPAAVQAAVREGGEGGMAADLQCGALWTHAVSTSAHELWAALVWHLVPWLASVARVNVPALCVAAAERAIMPAAEQLDDSDSTAPLLTEQFWIQLLSAACVTVHLQDDQVAGAVLGTSSPCSATSPAAALASSPRRPPVQPQLPAHLRAAGVAMLPDAGASMDQAAQLGLATALCKAAKPLLKREAAPLRAVFGSYARVSIKTRGDAVKGMSQDAWARFLVDFALSPRVVSREAAAMVWAALAASSKPGSPAAGMLYSAWLQACGWVAVHLAEVRAEHVAEEHDSSAHAAWLQLFAWLDAAGAKDRVVNAQRSGVIARAFNLRPML